MSRDRFVWNRSVPQNLLNVSSHLLVMLWLYVNRGLDESVMPMSEIVKNTLVDLKVLRGSWGGNETNHVNAIGTVSLDSNAKLRVKIMSIYCRGARVAFEDEFRAAEEREVSCEAQQGRSRVKRKLFGSCRNNMGDVRTLIIEEAHATKYSIRPGVNEAVARHGVHVSSIPDRDGMYIKVLKKDVEVVRNTSRYDWEREAEIGESKMIGLELEQETTKCWDHVMMKVSPSKGVVRFGKKGELEPRYIGPIEILERIGPVAYWLRLPDELSIRNHLSGVKISSKPEIWLIL
ncbi:hypothetical protein Tco_0798923 [Tanacetum coccineum]